MVRVGFGPKVYSLKASSLHSILLFRTEYNPVLDMAKKSYDCIVAECEWNVVQNKPAKQMHIHLNCIMRVHGY